MRRGMVAGALAAILVSAGGIAVGAATKDEPAARVVPVVERRCGPVRSCWFDHWGNRRCFRRWVCDRDARSERWNRAPARRYSLDEDYAPESGPERDREPSFRRYNGWEQPREPEVVRPRRRGVPPVRDRVDVQPRLKRVPDAAPERAPKTDADRQVAPELVVRRAPPVTPEADSEATKAPAAPSAPKDQSARLKQPPAPTAPKTDRPSEAAPPAEAKPAPDSAKKQARPAPKDRKAQRAPDDIDKLPRGRKIPMDEINPPKPKKKLRERLPI